MPFGINNVKSPFFVSSSCCVWIACAQSLYLGIIKSSLVHISAGSFGCLACHDLRNEFLLIFENLEEVRIERFVGNVTIDINFGIFVTLALNSTVALLHVGGTFHTEHFKETNRTSRDILNRSNAETDFISVLTLLFVCYYGFH